MLNDYVKPIVTKINSDLGDKYISNPQFSNYVFYIDKLHVQGKIIHSDYPKDEFIKMKTIPLVLELAINQNDQSQIVYAWKVDLIEFYKLG